MSRERVVVVGGGIGGLCACLELTHLGFDVTLLEKEQAIGGKIRQVAVGASNDIGLVDSGPTVFTMRWVFEQLFDACGESFSAHVRTDPLTILARHTWGESHLDLFADRNQSADAIAAFSSPAEAKAFLEFCAMAKKVYEVLEKPFIQSARPSMAGMIGSLGIMQSMPLMAIGPFSDLWSSLGKYFKDPRLHQLFGRYATYCGSSPFLAPATLMLIAQVEMDGVWSVRGGMAEIPKAIGRLAESKGARIRTNASVQAIHQGHNRITSIELADGEHIPADYVVFNGDINALRQGLLGESLRSAISNRIPTSRSLSALTWSMKVKTGGFPLVRHNVFFNRDYASEFSSIFQHKAYPNHPTVYVCAQDRSDSGAALEQEERLLCLVNAPAIGDHAINQKEIDRCEQTAFTLLKQCGLELQEASHSSIRTSPTEFNRLFPGRGGALYGQATHGWMSSFQRSNALTQVENLFLVGGSVHPGPGVPMAALSGRQAVAALMARRNSTKR
jgi:1-hydroxycarotenoid 3,4-desaturase